MRFCLVFLFSLLCAPALAAPEEAPAAGCGADSHSAIAAAERELGAHDKDAQPRALACLIVALKALEAERLDAVRGNDKAHMLSVPKNP